MTGPVTAEDCLKLTSYFGERHRTADGFTADALLGLYGRHQVAASVLLRGISGFGTRQHARTDQSLTLSEDLPLVAVAVDTRDRIEAIADEAVRLTGDGLVTLERARLLTGPGFPAAVPADLGDSVKLTIYLGRHQRVYRVPAFAAVCDLLHRRGVAGATVLLGVDGTAHGDRQRATFFGRNTRTPLMVISIGSAARIIRVLPELGGLLPDPLLTLEKVTIRKRDGERLSDGPCADASDDGRAGMPLWHKLMVYTSEAALCDGQPIHRAIVRRLRAAGLSGATTMRGIWGFHGDHLPHGDRLLQLGRHVPAVTVVIDTPERIADAYAVIDDLTGEQGLVTSEIVPAARAGLVRCAR